MDPREIIDRLALAPHPEGGWFRETWRADAPPGTRASGTAIFFLLEAHQTSTWHRVDAAEIWHWHAGAPLTLSISPDGTTTPVDRLLGPDLALGQSPQVIVPPHAWQAAAPQGGWTLVGCTVSPGFDFAHFTLAPPTWEPGHGDPA